MSTSSGGGGGGGNSSPPTPATQGSGGANGGGAIPTGQTAKALKSSGAISTSAAILIGVSGPTRDQRKGRNAYSAERGPPSPTSPRSTTYHGPTCEKTLWTPCPAPARWHGAATPAVSPTHSRAATSAAAATRARTE
ncbi:hypothetical protein PG985_009308 [Apiospora marii]|uniref:Uncharacterized protein n=1 Tax=Apiospora marii TaxID=335849 RepID=A0ABR1RAY1_9PEZI